MSLGPQIVFDPSAVARLVTQLQQQLIEIGVVRQVLQAALQNMRKLQNPSLRSITATLSQIDVLVRQGQAITYSLAALDAEFQRTFPGAQLSTTMAADMRTQRSRTLATIRGALNAAQATAQQFPVGAARLAEMKTQLASIGSAQQAAELASSVSILTTEELTLLRQQLAAQGSAEAVFLANTVNHDAQAAAAALAFDLAGATRPAARARVPIQQLGF